MTPHIMVLKHDCDVLDMMEELLQSEGYQTTTYLFGKDQHPIQSIDEAQPDLVITDHIPYRGSQEWTFIKQLRSYKESKTIPLIICTTNPARAHDHIDPLHMPYTVIIPEPFPIEVLLERATRLLSSARKPQL